MEVRVNRKRPSWSQDVIQNFEPSKHAYPRRLQTPIILRVESGEAGHAGGIDAGGIDQGDACQASPRLRAGGGDQHKQGQKSRRDREAQAPDAVSGSTPRIKAAPDPRLSRSFEYSVAVLESFSRERRPLGISELANIMGLSRPTTHRYAVTLVALGYLEQDDKRRYRLSTRAAGPGRSAIGAVRRQVSAQVALEDLRDKVGYTVSMGVLDRNRVVYVHRLFGHRRGQYAIDMDLGVGASVPVYCTALGKVLLASVSDAERRELLEGLQLVPHGPNSVVAKSDLADELGRMNVREPAVSDEELIAGSRSVAVLVPRPAGEYPLAIEVTVPSGDYTAKQLLDEVGPLVKRTASLISEA